MVGKINENNFYDNAIVENKAGKGESVKNQEIKQDVNTKGNYSAVSKDGDTLELSGAEKKEQQKAVVIDKVQPKMSEAMLRHCSKEKLKQLLHDGKISQQQYDKVVNNTKS